MTKTEIIKRLHTLSVEMHQIGLGLNAYYGEDIRAEHGHEMMGAARIAADWAESMEMEHD